MRTPPRDWWLGWVCFWSPLSRTLTSASPYFRYCHRAEQRQVLVDWNDTRAEFPETCIHALIESQAQRTPDAVAVVCGDEALTYRELNRRANAVAWRLREQGVGPECTVGLCADRSADLVVGLLGILKAGGAYLPLDPSYPEARLALMLEDSGASVVLAHQHLAGALPFGERTVVPLDVPGEADAAPPRCVGPDNLAYVLYTSGSTGKPKGVLIPHRNVVSFFTGMDARVGRRAGDVARGDERLLRHLRAGVALDAGAGLQGRRAGRAGRARGRTAPGGPVAPEASGVQPLLLRRGRGGAGRGALPAAARGRAVRGHAMASRRCGRRSATFTPLVGSIPIPSVTSAAIAAITERVAIRAGSVVLPLHHPVRVAEEWSARRQPVERAASASPWRRAGTRMTSSSRRSGTRSAGSWRGETWTRCGGSGAVRRCHSPMARGRPSMFASVRSPVQRELPVWLTAAGNPDTFREAGRLGAGVLTHLLGAAVGRAGSTHRALPRGVARGGARG